MKNKLFVVINVLGLGIALSCTVVAFLSWNFNDNYDVQHVNAANIYRINFERITNGEMIKNGMTPQPLGAAIRENITEIDEVIRISPDGGNFRVKDELFRTSVFAVDPAFLDVFTFPLVSGRKENLNDKGKIFISTELKEKYFPDSEALDQPMTYISDDKRIEFIVGGVFEKPPQNSSFYMNSFVHYDNIYDINGWDREDWTIWNNTFVYVDDPKDIPAVEKGLQNYVEIQNRVKEDYKVNNYYLDPLVGMAVRAEQEDMWNNWLRGSMPTAAVVAPIVMAVLILLIACFNFTNTSIAIANRRLKEIGIRKVMGSRRKQIVAQFLGENILLTLMALVVGLLLAEILVPAYNRMWPFLDISLSYTDNIVFIIFLVVLLIGTGVIAGAYPAFYISKFEPSSILRGTLKYGKTGMFTKVLLTLQFSISLVAIVSGFLFSENAEYQKNYDMGFNSAAVCYAFIYDEDGYNAFKTKIEQNSKVLEVAGSRHNLTSGWYTDPIKFESSEMDVDILDIGDNYLKTTGATIIEGRDFIQDSQSDVETSVIVNQTLVDMFGWENAIGQRIVLRDTVELYVVGVVRDIYLQGGLWDPVEPMLMRYAKSSDYLWIAVSARKEDITSVYEAMNVVWKEVYPDELSRVDYMDEEIKEAVEVNENIQTMFVFLGIVAVVLSAIGLFSMVSLNIIKRMKEIGVRKVLGASTPHIVHLINKQFLIMISLSFVLGSVMSYFMVDMLMGSIWTYYVPIGPMAFILSFIILLLVCSITVGGKVVKAATANPAYTLKDE
jgi:ABC-type antimicrobial peptide transport system permease subunit